MKKKIKMHSDDQENGFISHLAELRKRLIHSFFFLIIFFLCCYIFAEHLYGFLVEPFAKAVKDDGADRRLIFTALQETFLTYLKVSFLLLFLLHAHLYLCKFGNLLLQVFINMKKLQLFRT